MSAPQEEWRIDNWAVFRITAIIGSVIGIAILCWLLSNVLLLAFGAVLFAVLLRSLARPLVRWTRLPQQLAVIAAALFIFLVVGGLVALFGSRLSGQITDLAKAIPEAVASLEAKLGVPNLYQQLIHSAGPNTERLLSGLTNLTFTVASAIADGVVIIVAGVFIALDPTAYKQGLLLLFPGNQRAELGNTLDHTAAALEQWLLGQLIAMVLVGVLTSIALVIVGLPSPIALGVIAGIAEFIPMLGPVIGAIAPMILALTKGPWIILWTFLAFLAVQQIESNMIMPIVQRRMVSLPPALTLFGVFAFGAIFGILGVFLATPMLVVAYVFVTQLYVRDTLGEKVTIPGQKNLDPDSQSENT